MRLRLSAPEGSVCTLRLWSDAGEQKLPMRLRGYMDGSCLYEVQLPPAAAAGDPSGTPLWSSPADSSTGTATTAMVRVAWDRSANTFPHLIRSRSTTRITRCPSWMHDGIMYQIFCGSLLRRRCAAALQKPGLVTHKNWNDLPNEYSNKPLGPNLGHDFFGGNLNGIIEKLPYLKNLGVTVLYLNPIFDAQSNHKYDTGDYTHVDPTFGTNEDFVRLCKAARSQGIRVMLDGVFSHTGDNSVYFNRYGLYNSIGAYQSKDSPTLLGIALRTSGGI